MCMHGMSCKAIVRGSKNFFVRLPSKVAKPHRLFGCMPFPNIVFLGCFGNQANQNFTPIRFLCATLLHLSVIFYFVIKLLYMGTLSVH